MTPRERWLAVLNGEKPDNQQTLPFGTPVDVEREVQDNLRIFVWPARYVCAPCHNLQPNTPTENILALYRAAHAYGKL